MRRSLPALLAATAVLAAAPASAQPVPPLEPVPFRTVAKDDGASSKLKRRTAFAIRSERRWQRVWLKLTATIDPRPRRPRIDFARHVLLVAVQGRQPSGGHRTTITGVGGTPPAG